MLSFLALHGGTILVGALVFAIISAIIVKMVKDKRKGKHPGCGCGGCAGCPADSACHRE